MGLLREYLQEFLPEGCPFVIGGGLIRDAILGGRPSDIDVWLPSNINYAGAEEFYNRFVEQTAPTNLSLVFSGPGASTDWDFTPGVTQSDYGDVNNHWVFEADISYLWPKVNFMRSMTPWEGDAQSYFNGLMRAFDIDVCMMFVAWMPTDPVQQRTVIMPRHLVDSWTGQNDIADRFAFPTWRLRMNELHFNAGRANTTSETRLQSRIEKMCNKYGFVSTSVRNISVIDTDQIIATPVSFLKIIRRINRISSGIPYPTYTNSLQEARNGTTGTLFPPQGQVPAWN